MKKFDTYLKNKFLYTEYQVQVLYYFFLTISSEISKFTILLLYFIAFSKLTEYLFAILLLWFFRFFGGGLHRKTYWGCLLFSFTYLFLCIQVLPMIYIPKLEQITFLLFSLVVACKIKPIPSPYRKNITKTQISRYHHYQLWGIFLYMCCIIMFPQNSYIEIGFWVIMLHIIQLSIAYKEVKK